MKRQRLFRRTRNREIVRFPCCHPEPGQRLTITKFTGLEDIWYHPDDWTPADADAHPRP